MFVFVLWSSRHTNPENLLSDSFLSRKLLILKEKLALIGTLNLSYLIVFLYRYVVAKIVGKVAFYKGLK